MIRPALLLLCLALPGTVLAQGVLVRSGEHGDFTRLVFDMPAGTEWSLDQDPAERRIAVDFGPNVPAIDVSGVFDRIDRSRLANIILAEDGTGVELSLSCPCDAEAFVLRDRMLVVDIRPAADGSDIANADLSVDRPVTATAQAGLAADLARVRVAGVPGIGPARALDPLLPHLPGGKPPASGRGGPPSPADTPRDMTDVLAIGDQLAADLAAAATEGILNASVNPVPSQRPGIPAENLRSFAPDGRAVDGPDLVEQLANGLSGVDHSAPGGRRIQVGGTHCVLDSDLAVGSWSDDETDINAVLADRRSTVFGEFDRIDPTALTIYAQSLLHFGFGAEARATLDLNQDDASRVLRALSHLIDGDPDPSGVFLDQTNCPGDAALWSVVALPDQPGNHLVDTSAVLRAFEKLPVHLREHFGPGLSARLSGAGYPDAARDVLSRLLRSKGMETDSIALGRAQIDLKQGKLDAAEAPLRSLATEGGPESPQAILASIELARTADKPVPGYLVELAAAFATEFRNSEEGPDFWKAHLTALLLNGAFEDAHDAILGADEAYIPSETAADMRNTALEMLVSRAPDVPFLKIAMQELQAGFRPTRDQVTVDIARRFTDLGLADAALGQLAMIPPASRLDSQAKVLRARALLELGRPEEAEIILIGQRGADVDRLRAVVRDRMGDHELAGTLYSELGEDALARQAAWLSGDWTSVANGSDDALAQAAALVQAPPDPGDPTNPSLAAAEGLSASSAETRDTIRALLEATRLTEN